MYKNGCDVIIGDNRANAVNIITLNNISAVLDYFITKTIRPLTLASSSAVGSYTATFTDTTSVSAGNHACFQEDLKGFQPGILANNTGTNTLTFDTQFGDIFTPASIITEKAINMNVDGSTTPIIFDEGPLTAGGIWDITRIMVYIQDNVVMDDAKFGGLSELTRGVSIRKNIGNGTTYENLFNIKTNGELALRTFDLVYADKMPAGSYSITSRKTFAGPENHGTAVRLDQSKGELIEVVIQDDLTDLDKFYIVFQGHAVSE